MEKTNSQNLTLDTLHVEQQSMDGEEIFPSPSSSVFVTARGQQPKK